ncbi:hypothetical protein NEIMUCOT_04138 [Neisseria mucosa ATCC 25996]|uniref:Uncharacterized protein n=1 Tax=Neisseria mucosa (strain ATCC 25996 / DSM 4631 / NCTC 10774 / M26) TaxID=546266 RepID=D2ZU50_NEIM2|nr:hypothetical protein NEIMUCOT_04138 [Neisseria mucosa ATCC 25996]
MQETAFSMPIGILRHCTRWNCKCNINSRFSYFNIGFCCN